RLRQAGPNGAAFDLWIVSAGTPNRSSRPRSALTACVRKPRLCYFPVMADPETRPPLLRLTLMGRVRLSVGEGLLAVASRRGRGLLGHLVFAGPSGVTREKLGGLLWSDRGEAQARASLRQCLLELRGVLQPHDAHAALDVRRELVALDG